jgi:hypothetical protein
MHTAAAHRRAAPRLDRRRTPFEPALAASTPQDTDGNGSPNRSRLAPRRVLALGAGHGFASESAARVCSQPRGHARRMFAEGVDRWRRRLPRHLRHADPRAVRRSQPLRCAEHRAPQRRGPGDDTGTRREGYRRRSLAWRLRRDRLLRLPEGRDRQATLVVLEDGSFRLSANECSGSTQGFGPFTPTCWTTFASGYLETSGVEFFFHYRCLDGKTSEREDWSWYTVRACGRDGYPYPGEFLWLDLDGTPVTYRRR